MRLVTTLTLALLLAPAALAQPCDPAEATYETACPDTTDWKRYFPLAVGNQWQYERSAFCGVEGFPPCRFGSEIIGSEVIEDVQYFLIRRCTEELSGEVSCGEAQPIRYDEELRTIVYWAANGTVHPRTYNLALPFGYPVEWEVDGEPFELHVDGRYGVTFDLGAGPSLVGTSKAFASIGGGVSFFSGIGETGSWGDGSMVSEDLTYARVAGVEYGVQAFGFPSSDEPGASAPAAFALRSVYPNPAREAATVAYTLGRAQDVTLEVLDVLGRVVRTEEVGPQAAGPHEARLATDGLPSGLYLVRLHGDGVEATRRLVVLR